MSILQNGLTPLGVWHKLAYRYSPKPRAKGRRFILATSYMDYTLPTTQFTYDLSQNPLFQKDDNNYINSLSIQQLNTLGNASLLDIFLSTGNVVEPHTHPNATELVYCISGSAVVSLINPFTNELLNFTITPGQVANVPQGWWHYEVAIADHTHLLAIFDAPVPEAIFGSDTLRLTPAALLAHTYCLDVNKVKETLAPIQKTVIIGPPADCATEISPTTNNMLKPNSQPNAQPYVQENAQPYVQQPNAQPYIQPNVQPNAYPYMQPYVSRLPYWGTWVDPRIIHEPGCPYYRELPVNANHQG